PSAARPRKFRSKESLRPVSLAWGTGFFVVTKAPGAENQRTLGGTSMSVSVSSNGLTARLVKAALVAACASVAVGLCGLLSRPAAAQAQGGFDVRSLSTRADLVSGGDVLVQVRRPTNVTADR